MKRNRTLIAILALVVAIGLGIYFIRPPGPGQVYHYRSDQYGIAGHTALLLQNGNCLVLSRSEADIGRAEAAAGAEERLFVIAATGRVSSASDGRGPYLRDERSELVARPGDAIDGEIVFKPTFGDFGDTFAAGWPLDDECGHGLAIVHSVARVHR